MNLKRALPLLLLWFAALATPSFAQTYWSSYNPAGVTDDIWGVAYAKGTFAAVTNQGNVLVSSDGLTWSSQTIAPGVWLLSIAYGNGTWVVVGDKGTILESSDLRTWVLQTPVTANRLNGVQYTSTGDSSGLFVAVGNAGSILTSPDGQTWTLQPTGVTGFLHGILAGSWQSILVTGQGGVLLKGSLGGTGFEPIQSGITEDLEAVADAPAGAVAVGANGVILFSSYSGNGLTLISTAFDTWNNVTMPATSATFRGVAWGNGYFVAVGEQGTILTSPDGMTWKQRFAGNSPSTASTATFLSAAYSPDLRRFVVTGTGGAILVSDAAPTVFGNVSTRGFVSNSQTFIGGFFVAGSASRAVLIRADGPVLSQFSVANPLPDPVLTVYDSNGDIIASNAGWTTNTSPSTLSSAAQQVGAFALPNPSADSALLLTLKPGAYTAQITSAKGNSGIALFEAYTD